ncbi:MAG: LysR substrate-binding domain-containing protein, partial [Myxococcota bacterium]
VELTLEQFQTLAHVRISPQGFGSSATDRRLQELGIERSILVYTFSFATAPELVARTDAVLTLPEWVARIVAPRLGLRILPPPFDIPGFQLDMLWHQGRDDAALAWFRDAFAEVAAEVRAAYAPEG